MTFVFLEGMKKSYDKDDNEIEEQNENTYLDENKIDNAKSSSDFTELDKTAEESQKIISVVQKMITSVYQAGLVSDNLSLRQDIYNMFSEKVIQELINDGEYVSVESILNYTFYVDDVSNYAIGKIYRCNENNNVVQYAAVLRYQKNVRDPLDNYFVVNVDYGNNTFAYGGMVSNLDDVDGAEELEEIRNKGSNSF